MTTLTDFIKHFNKQDYTSIMTTFCNDDTTHTPHAPCVGITDHGPAFTGTIDVQTLFSQLFTTFNKLTWNSVQATWATQSAAMPSWTGNNLGPVTSEVAVQFWLTGVYANDWFQPGDGSGHDSPPLSSLHNYPNGQNMGRKRGDKSGNGLPGVALFSFDSGGLIRQLQIHRSLRLDAEHYPETR